MYANALFIVGPVGTGKTHLAEHILSSTDAPRVVVLDGFGCYRNRDALHLDTAPRDSPRRIATIADGVDRAIGLSGPGAVAVIDEPGQLNPSTWVELAGHAHRLLHAGFVVVVAAIRLHVALNVVQRPGAIALMGVADELGALPGTAVTAAALVGTSTPAPARTIRDWDLLAGGRCGPALRAVMRDLQLVACGNDETPCQNSSLRPKLPADTPPSSGLLG